MSKKLRPFHIVVLTLTASLLFSMFVPDGPPGARRASLVTLKPLFEAVAPLRTMGAIGGSGSPDEADKWRAAFLRERALRIADRLKWGAMPGDEPLSPEPALEEALRADLGRATLIMARVIHRDASPLRNGILVDVGEENGVRTGAPVTVGPAVVGRVVRVFETMAQVRLLDDPQSRLRAFAIADVGDDGYELRRGVLVGRGGGQLEMRSLIGAGVSEGSTIVTDMSDFRVPAYLVLGRVREVRDRNYDGVVEVSVVPVVNLEMLTDVGIWITPAPPEGPWDDDR